MKSVSKLVLVAVPRDMQRPNHPQRPHQYDSRDRSGAVRAHGQAPPDHRTATLTRQSRNALSSRKKTRKSTHPLVLEQGSDLVLDRNVRVFYACLYCPGLLADVCPLLTNLPPFSHKWIYITDNCHEFPEVLGSEWGSTHSRAFALELGGDRCIFIVMISPKSHSIGHGREELGDCGQIR